MFASKIKLALFTLFMSLFAGTYAQNARYHSFENIKLDLSSSTVTCILQDSLGFIWLGTNSGLYNYDGYGVQAFFSPNDETHTQIHCGRIIDEHVLYLGSDHGLLIFNTLTDRYESPPLTFPGDIRSMALQGDSLWLGTLNGLYLYHLSTQKLQQFTVEQNPGLPHKTVYALAVGPDNSLWIGTYNGLCRYLPDQKKFVAVPLPKTPGRSNQFVNSLLPDPQRQCIWVGMEGGLYHYSCEKQEIMAQSGMRGKSVKSLNLDAGNSLVIGTDNGIYVYRENEALHHLTHDSRNPNSLINNIVWSIFTDQNKNLWFGTGGGLSLVRNNASLTLTPIYEITKREDGNQFYSLYKDTRGYFWMGGSNGLIRTELEDGEWKNTLWYNTSHPHYPLPHGRIRHIYETPDGELWIATDGSINRYNYERQQFEQFTLLDERGKLNSNWAYNILQDQNENLWVATCLGGIFVIQKEKLLQNKSGTYLADNNLNTQNGLSGMFINQFVQAPSGELWVLLYNDSINVINPESKAVQVVDSRLFHNLHNPAYLLCDADGYIWIGFKNGVLRIHPETMETAPLYFETTPTNDLLAMAEVEDNLWISTTDGFWLVNKHTLTSQYLNLSENRFLSMFYDKKEAVLYLGDVDQIGTTSPKVVQEYSSILPLYATRIFINNELLTTTQSNRMLQQIPLNYQQNNIALEISDLPYTQSVKSKLVYKLDELEEDWNPLDSKTKRIAYSNLNHGEYQLHIARLTNSGEVDTPTYSLLIHIDPPWYLSIWAKVIYGLVLLTLAGWTINFFRVKNRLRIERFEKQKITEQSRMKMEFLTHLSHELKSPLSMIIAPASRMLSETKDRTVRTGLRQIHTSALKLNALIHQILDFNRIDSASKSLLILGEVEMVSFTRKLFYTFEAAAQKQNLTFQFEANVPSLFMETDQVKWEAILTNLLGNAVKYSPNGGSVQLLMHVNDSNGLLTVQVTDTGMGIPAADIPYIFQRFYQSSKNAKSVEGSGIGLYLVKTYTELLGGTVNVQSAEEQGSTFIVQLPATGVNDGTSSSATHESVPASAPAKGKRPLILVVDDHTESANFLHDVLKDDFECHLATNGVDGLNRCQELHPDLLVTDIRMPQMDGLEMLKILRKKAPFIHLPVIVLTGKNDKHSEMESIHLNVDLFLQKPFEPQILLSRIHQLLTQKQELEAKIRLEKIASPQVSDTVSLDEKILADITRLIEEHMADSDLNVSGLSRLSGMSSKQLYRKIKQLTGLSPVDYIKSIRMKKAAMLLRQQKFSIAELMYMVGYTNHSYFSKCFKAHFNQTPLQYKESQDDKA